MALDKDHMYEVKGNPVVWGTENQAKQPTRMAPIAKLNLRNRRELKIEIMHSKGDFPWNSVELKNRMCIPKNQTKDQTGNCLMIQNKIAKKWKW